MRVSFTNTVSHLSTENDNLRDNLRTVFQLDQNFPNPFNPTTRISYTLAKSGMVVLNVFDTLGRKIRTVVHEFQAAGIYQVKFDASQLPSGIYYYELRQQDFREVRKMVILD